MKMDAEMCMSFHLRSGESEKDMMKEAETAPLFDFVVYRKQIQERIIRKRLELRAQPKTDTPKVQHLATNSKRIGRATK